ncbi:hypothetical protein [Solemya elarraichensis gill symbiont]|uniref:Uncharacterized protein n=1 Tax=Solemya elarraichensis gill symbiont TaxID=1918949 RepID=A0A1T2L912_9GAMM|nr:hypothetical protein [Solemya elarraichensis gill symbiont]OOZ41595.1 hypothetical protein BOW52_04435 [Solemya elarraichensis gill symbiont]
MRKQIEKTAALTLLMFSTPLLASHPEGSSLKHELVHLFDQPGFLLAAGTALLLSLGIPLGVTLYREMRESMQIKQLIQK